MSLQAFTPAYLQREHTAPALLQSDNDRTAYTWGVQTTPRADDDWAIAAGVDPPMPEAPEEVCEDEMYPELPRPRGPEDYYKRVYDDLTKQVAYRWPNPGTPRHREGCIGGTWRHIKEVLGHGGSRFVFVDGLVSVYDDQKFTQKLQAQLPYRPHIRPLYAPVKEESTIPPTRASLSAYPVLPNLPAASLSRDPNVARKLQLQQRFPNQRRGFYRFP